MLELTKIVPGAKVRRLDGSRSHFTQYKVYDVIELPSGKVGILDDDGDECSTSFISSGERWALVEEAPQEVVGAVSITSYDIQCGNAWQEIIVEVKVDERGFQSLVNLERKSKKEDNQRLLDAQIAQVEKQLAKLKAERETIE